MADQRSISRMWVMGGVALLCCAISLHMGSSAFAYETEIVSRPIFTFVIGYMLAGAIYLAVAWKAMEQSLAAPAPGLRHTLLIVAGFGLAMRIVLFGSDPVMEDDYHRYLWDGALAANGINPWTHAPADIINGSVTDPAMTALKAEAGSVLTRINYADLKTIYPAVPQAFFALAYWIKPFSLDAWRLVLLGLELATFGLILALLSALGRPLLWVTIYWWNPIVIKEVMNSAHMEPTLIVPLLVAVLFMVRAHPVVASAFAGVAVAAKVWPVLILPVFWRGLLKQPGVLIASASVAIVISVLLYLPVIMAQLNATSGFVAFATQWERISASFLILGAIANLVPQSLIDADQLARLIAAGLVGSIVLWTNRSPVNCPESLVARILVAAAALLLLSPVQLPWYFIWLVPFLCVRPSRGLLLMTVTFPIYYAFFKLTAQDASEVILLGLVWAMWLPVWMMIIHDWRTAPQEHRHA